MSRAQDGDYSGMKKKKIIILCILGVLFFCAGIAYDLNYEHSDENELIKAVEEEEQSVDHQDEQPEQMQSTQKEEIKPERILLDIPTVELNGKEGVMSYRWGKDCISIDETTVFFSCDCYFPDEELQQKIFFIAKAPDFVPQEVFRQNSRKEFRTSGGTPEVLEKRMISPVLTEAGYIYELDGALYCLSEDFEETSLICDIRELMGELYEFSPWVVDKNQCDVTENTAKMLACTDEGLFEYDLFCGEKMLLEPAVFRQQEIVHVEGDCDCGETGFEFSGPIDAEYAPGDQSYVFLTGTEYGDPVSITLRSEDGKTLYQKELSGYIGDFEWLESEDADYLAVFYREEEGTWMDRVDVNTGEEMTFAVPDEVFDGTYLCVGFLDAGRLIYRIDSVSDYSERKYGIKSEYEIYQLYSEERMKMEAEAEKVNWKIKVLSLGDFDSIIVKVPEE